jgi:hypothetical protein
MDRHNPYAVQLHGNVMIGRKIAIDIARLTEPALPLDTLDKNCLSRCAVYRMAKVMRLLVILLFRWEKYEDSSGDDYIDRVSAFSKVKDSVDFAPIGFRLAHDNLGENGRAGLVGTNSIVKVRVELQLLTTYAKRRLYS